jgi:hypothetical protein
VPVAEPRVVLLGRAGCHLCDEARAVVAEVCAEQRVDWAERDIDTDPELLARHRDEIPVTFVDGRVHDTWYVDAARLRRALAR